MTLKQYVEHTDSIPKDSYEDYILWYCLKHGVAPNHPGELTAYPDFMTVSEYGDFSTTFIEVKRILETLIAPLSGSGSPLGQIPQGQGISVMEQ